MTRIIPALAIAVAGALITGCAATSSTPQAVHTTPPAAVAAPSPAPPAANPQGNITGSCDVSLSTAIYGQNYLTASVTAHNTGNVGTVVRIKVIWPLQGFPPITKAKTVRTRPGSSRMVQFNAPITQEQVSQFQDVQMNASGDPCNYKATITSTFGTPQ